MSIQPHSLTQTSTVLQFNDAASCMRWIAVLPVSALRAHVHGRVLGM